MPKYDLISEKAIKKWSLHPKAWSVSLPPSSQNWSELFGTVNPDLTSITRHDNWTVFRLADKQVTTHRADPDNLMEPSSGRSVQTSKVATSDLQQSENIFYRTGYLFKRDDGTCTCSHTTACLSTFILVTPAHRLEPIFRWKIGASSNLDFIVYETLVSAKVSRHLKENL